MRPSTLWKEKHRSSSVTGEQRTDEFIDECCADPERFENKITQEKTHSTFANEGVTKKSMKDNKEVHLKMERNIFARLLHMALDRKVDMGEVLKYPLTAVPLALGQIDGTMRSTAKNKLMNNLKNRLKSTSPTHMMLDSSMASFFFIN